MNTVIIENTDKWCIESHSNGGAYTMTDKTTGRDMFVQYGDDAAQWREEFDAMERAYADPASVWHRQTWNTCLAELFNPGDEKATA